MPAEQAFKSPYPILETILPLFYYTRKQSRSGIIGHTCKAAIEIQYHCGFVIIPFFSSFFKKNLCKTPRILKMRGVFYEQTAYRAATRSSISIRERTYTLMLRIRFGISPYSSA